MGSAKPVNKDAVTKPKTDAATKAADRAERARKMKALQKMLDTRANEDTQANEELAKELEKLKNEDAMDLDEEDKPNETVEQENPVKQEDDNTTGKERAPPILVTGQRDPFTPSPSEDPDEDPDDVLRPSQQFEMLSSAAKNPVDENSEYIGWLKGSFGRKFVIVQHGPKNSATFRVTPGSEVDSSITDNGKMNLGKARCADVKLDDKYVYDIVAIQAVAWNFPSDHECPMELLNPNKWPKGKGGRRVAPFTQIKVKLKKKGSEDEVVCWETRTSVRRLWGEKVTTLPDDFMWATFVVARKGEKMKLADLAIMTAAKVCEERYNKWFVMERLGNSRSPSAVPALQAVQDKEDQL